MADKTVESYEQLIKLNVDDLVTRAQAYITITARVDKAVKQEKADRRQAGKVMAAFKRVYAEKVDAGELPEGTPFTEFFEMRTKAKPNGRVEQLAVTFNFFVVGKLIKESDYDKCANDWLEKASKLSKAVGNDLKHPLAKQAADVLRERYDDGAKRLRLMIAEATGKTDQVDDSGKEFTLEQVTGFVKIALDKGYGPDLLRTVTGLVETEGKDWGEETQRALFTESLRLSGDVWAKAVEQSTLDSWMTETDEAEAPVKLATPEVDYAAEAQKLYKGKLSEEQLENAVFVMKAYIEEHGTTPSKSQFEAHGKALAAKAAA